VGTFQESTLSPTNQRTIAFFVLFICTVHGESTVEILVGFHQERCKLYFKPCCFVPVAYVQGFLDIRMKKWLRNLMTRCIAIAPSLVVSIIGGSNGAGRLIIIASVRHIPPPIYGPSGPSTTPIYSTWLILTVAYHHHQ